MKGKYLLILGDFHDELDAVTTLVKGWEDFEVNKVRAASSNSSVLLIVAMFGEFIIQMANEFTKEIVSGTEKFEKLPRKLRESVAERISNLVTLSSGQDFPLSGKQITRKLPISTDMLPLFKFACGDLSEEIYEHIHVNVPNMRVEVINDVFSVTGIKNICEIVCKSGKLQNFFDVSFQIDAHKQFKYNLDEFIRHRNNIAHSLNSVQFLAVDEVLKKINMLKAFADDLCSFLESK